MLMECRGLWCRCLGGYVFELHIPVAAWLAAAELSTFCGQLFSSDSQALHVW